MQLFFCFKYYCWQTISWLQSLLKIVIIEKKMLVKIRKLLTVVVCVCLFTKPDLYIIIAKKLANWFSTTSTDILRLKTRFTSTFVNSKIFPNFRNYVLSWQDISIHPVKMIYVPNLPEPSPFHLSLHHGNFNIKWGYPVLFAYINKPDSGSSKPREGKPPSPLFNCKTPQKQVFLHSSEESGVHFTKLICFVVDIQSRFDALSKGLL